MNGECPRACPERSRRVRVRPLDPNLGHTRNERICERENGTTHAASDVARVGRTLLSAAVDLRRRQQECQHHRGSVALQRHDKAREESRLQPP